MQLLMEPHPQHAKNVQFKNVPTHNDDTKNKKGVHVTHPRVRRKTCEVLRPATNSSLLNWTTQQKALLSRKIGTLVANLNSR